MKKIPLKHNDEWSVAAWKAFYEAVKPFMDGTHPTLLTPEEIQKHPMVRKCAKCKRDYIVGNVRFCTDCRPTADELTKEMMLLFAAAANAKSLIESDFRMAGFDNRHSEIFTALESSLHHAREILCISNNL